MKRTFFGSRNTSIQAFLADLSPEQRQTAHDIFVENFNMSQLFQIKPWFDQLLDEKVIDIILFQAKEFGVTGQSINHLYEKARAFGLQFFSQDQLQQLELSFFNPIPGEERDIVVLIENAEWKVETRTNTGYDEYGGDCEYEYGSLTLPTILSSVKQGAKKYEREGSVNEPSYYSMIEKNDYFLVYAERENTAAAASNKQPELQESE